jgi:hypothetical protein
MIKNIVTVLLTISLFGIHSQTFSSSQSSEVYPGVDIDFSLYLF